jgi:hypothetical protein
MQSSIIEQMKLFQKIQCEQMKTRFMFAVSQLSDDEMKSLGASDLEALLKEASLYFGDHVCLTLTEPRSRRDLMKRVIFLRKWCLLRLVRRRGPAVHAARA